MNGFCFTQYVLHKSSSLTLFEVCKTRESGDHDIPDILFVPETIQSFLLVRNDQHDRLPHLFLMKYNTGRLLDSKLGLKISNTKPHSFEQSYCRTFTYITILTRHE